MPQLQTALTAALLGWSAMVPKQLPPGRLSRDAEWAKVLLEAWAADPEIAALPRRGEELELRETVYEHQGVQLFGIAVHEAHETGTAHEPSRPGVLVVHTGAGPRDLYMLWRACTLAARGYFALVVDLYGDREGSGWDAEFAGARMAELRNDRALLQGRMRAALAALRAHPLVDPQRCAALGWCLGGRAVLDLARGGSDVRGVVSFHGVLDALPAELLAETLLARLLICDGDLDPFNSDDASAQLVAQLRSRDADFEMVTYSRAKHGFTCPAQRLNSADAFDYHAVAAARSWELTRTFLAEVLGPARAPGATGVGVAGALGSEPPAAADERRGVR
jgi:dienelactone hydrolase